MVQRRGTRTKVVVSAVLAALVLGTTGACSGGDDEPPAAERSAEPTEATPEPAALAVTTGDLRGFLPKARHDRVVATVAEVVDGWVEQAWVAGPWPREVTDVWGAFTPGAAEQAQDEAALTSGAHYAQRVEAVLPTRRDVRVDVLARQGTPYAATARVTLDLDVTPTAEALGSESATASGSATGSSTVSPSPSASEQGDVRSVKLRGRVFLTREKDGWKIFGYDLARGGW